VTVNENTGVSATFNVDSNACGGAAAFACGVAHNGTMAGASATLNDYACAGAFDQPGEDVVHTLVTPTNGTVTVDLTNLLGDLDLFVLGACDAANCTGSSENGSMLDEQVIFQATAGQTDYVVVEDFASSGSTYTLTSTCPACAARDGENHTLTGATVTDTQTYHVFNTLTVGPNFHVNGPNGNLTPACVQPGSLQQRHQRRVRRDDNGPERLELLGLRCFLKSRAKGVLCPTESSHQAVRSPNESNGVSPGFSGTRFLSLSLAGCAGLTVDDVLEAAEAIGKQDTLDQETVVAGLREALRIGSQRTVDRTATVDGFLGNALIRIAMPEELGKMASTLRKIGFGRQVDELEVAMNRAAEEAAGGARDVFWEEIRGLTIPDAMEVLGGGPTAATDLLRLRTSDEIRERFRPIVVDKIEQVGLARLYTDLADDYNKLPFVSRPAVDLEEYVTEEALGGLFTVLGEEETKIREDPVARTTELLRKVFGQQ
jgi:hypothetical protein